MLVRYHVVYYMMISDVSLLLVLATDTALVACGGHGIHAEVTDLIPTLSANNSKQKVWLLELSVYTSLIVSE